jgi:hypothetical protein
LVFFEGVAMVGGAPTPAHTPAWHTSLAVHAFPSSHAVPSGREGLEQTPVAGSQTPAAWHASEGVQVTGVPAQTPF